MFPVGRLDSTVTGMMIGWSVFVERTVSTRRHDTFGPGETMMGFLATTTVHRLRGKVSFATTVFVTLSFEVQENPPFNGKGTREGGR